MARTHQCLLVAMMAVGMISVATAQGPTQSTLQDPKNAGACLQKFNTIISTYYANDPNCANLITTAMNSTVISQCPGGGISNVGSPVQMCMSGNNTNTNMIQAWQSFISGCEVMYIANRGGQSESEEGFTYQDNSCFPKFDAFSDFSAWLTGASSGAAATIRIAFFSTIAATALALFVMMV